MSTDIKREGASYMNKKLNLLVMLVSLLALGLLIGSCDNGTTSGGGGGTPTKFQGRWLNLDAISDSGYTDFSLTFNGNNVLFKQSGGGEATASESGTFTFTDTEFTITPVGKSDWETFTQRYTLENNVLTLESGSGYFYGPFTKQ
jgi:hypothetical protein